MIDKGRPWGREMARPSEIVCVRSDAELADLIADRLGSPAPPSPAAPAITLGAGDLARTLGTAGAIGDTVRSVDLDAVRYRTDSHHGWAVAHLVARSRRAGWLAGPILAVMNAEYRGRWDVVGRGHPNDGRVEIVEVDASMTVRQRLQARRRLATGTHLPHPSISVRSTSAARWDFASPRGLWVDDRYRGMIRWLEIEVVADAYQLIIG